MPGERVLVVDDYEDSRELYGQYLRSRGYDVETAPDGDAALRCALRRTCDIVVLDLALPKFDGLYVLRMLRSNARTKAIPVIILSASVGPDVRARALEAGANKFVTKPCAPDELEDVLREVLAARPP
ncbi:MAG: response regulator [Chloroflexi bacterium]|nr:MAG: response regulator [Deltaproteobacteria bacterium]TMD20640.1 MAG: response regulator [Chloroflexota bacterium]